MPSILPHHKFSFLTSKVVHHVYCISFAIQWWRDTAWLLRSTGSLLAHSHSHECLKTTPPPQCWPFEPWALNMLETHSIKHARDTLYHWPYPQPHSSFFILFLKIYFTICVCASGQEGQRKMPEPYRQLWATMWVQVLGTKLRRSQVCGHCSSPALFHFDSVPSPCSAWLTFGWPHPKGTPHS